MQVASRLTIARQLWNHTARKKKIRLQKGVVESLRSASTAQRQTCS